ncbi:hypothetical protein [Stigmatella erecta]|uniref:Knr4/Smi1-like domain-containing protein n=1 Tax=Stigmatella erecta TaxID=83460 RepID=A0A1I0KCG5_9BACT|nr:hypothetical protein [Stigmatella erecta]SEU22045.1 hypothetical protein SAMN05443639_11084 [Stigmatella erecta]
MKELIELICQYDPSYPQKIWGLSSEELSELEQLVGRPLPGQLKAFLRSMGKEPGDVLAAGLWPQAGRIQQFYLSARRYRLSPRYIFIATCEQPPGREYFYDCGLLAEAEDCPIVQARQGLGGALGEPFAPAFPSLKDMVFWMAFQTKRMEALPFRAFLRPTDCGYGATETAAMILEDLEELMPRLGFRRLPYTSGQNPLFERGDVALAAHGSSAPQDLSVVLAASQERERARLWETLANTTLLL